MELKNGRNDYSEDGFDTSEDMPMPFGPLVPLWKLAGVMVTDQKAEIEMWLEEQVQQEIDAAKLEGLEATRKAISRWNHNEEYKWDLMEVSTATANKMLRGRV